jgi:hypothetical protein
MVKYRVTNIETNNDFFIEVPKTVAEEHSEMIDQGKNHVIIDLHADKVACLNVSQ